jgi:pimeloyl-ACP methyl ester carboxylesterase
MDAERDCPVVLRPPDDTSDPATRVDHLIVIIHGIRTRAEWRDVVVPALGSDAGGAPLQAIQVKPLGYSYFDVFRFWCPLFFRKGPVDLIRSQLIAARDAHPNAKISVIAHSFGTYVIHQVLRTSPLRLHRLILCGSIIPNDARCWNTLRAWAPGGIRNDCCRRDIWPVLAEATTFGYGATGTFGAGVMGVEDVFHDFQGLSPHSAYLTADFVRKFWHPFVHEENALPRRPAPAAPPKTTPWARSVLPYLKYAALLCLVVLAILLYPTRPPAPAPGPELRLFILQPGGRTFLTANSAPLSRGDQLVLSPTVAPGRFAYVLALDGAGKAHIHTSEALDEVGWGWEVEGPPPTETLILLSTARALTPKDVDELKSRIDGLDLSPQLSSDTHILWQKGSWEVQKSDTPRGPKRVADTGWATRLADVFRSAPGQLSFHGRTFAVKAP